VVSHATRDRGIKWVVNFFWIHSEKDKLILEKEARRGIHRMEIIFYRMIAIFTKI
jgi:hypothetical protein